MDEDDSTTVFKSSIPIPQSEVKTLVIHCSDFRFQPQIDEFIHKGLGRESFDRIAVPGGSHFLLAGSLIPKLEFAGRKWTSFLTKKHTGINEVIIIGHEDCAWYMEMLSPYLAGRVPDFLKSFMSNDLRKGREILKSMFREVSVLLFYARINDGNVEFVEIAQI